MPEAKDDLKREKVRIVPISNIEDFPVFRKDYAVPYFLGENHLAVFIYSHNISTFFVSSIILRLLFMFVNQIFFLRLIATEVSVFKGYN